MPAELELLTPEDHLADLCAAYDALANFPYVDHAKIGVCAASYGAYIATLLTRERPVTRLLLRAPAMYGDDDYRQPLGFRRKSRADVSAPMLTGSLAAFKGEMLVLESGADEVIPHEVVAAYLAACPSARHRLIAGASHRLTDPEWEKQFIQTILNFFAE
jgi:pimeloyl-ACP methyl ester carboxylesterase